MPPLIDGTVSHYGAPDPSRLSRLWQSARPALWGLFAGTLICVAAVLLGGGL